MVFCAQYAYTQCALYNKLTASSGSQQSAIPKPIARPPPFKRRALHVCAALCITVFSRSITRGRSRAGWVRPGPPTTQGRGKAEAGEAVRASSLCVSSSQKHGSCLPRQQCTSTPRDDPPAAALHGTTGCTARPSCMAQPASDTVSNTHSALHRHAHVRAPSCCSSTQSLHQPKETAMHALLKSELARFKRWPGPCRMYRMYRIVQRRHHRDAGLNRGAQRRTSCNVDGSRSSQVQAARRPAPPMPVPTRHARTLRRAHQAVLESFTSLTFTARVATDAS